MSQRIMLCKSRSFIILLLRHLLLGSTKFQTTRVGKHHGLVYQMFEPMLFPPFSCRRSAWMGVNSTDISTATKENSIVLSAVSSKQIVLF